MGKKIKRFSIKTCKTVWIAYSKVAAIFFALFCAISGVSRPAYGKESTSNATIRGQVLNSKDSTILKNVKLYLCTIICPVYGVGLGCENYPKDSVITDSQGKFQINNSEGKYSSFALVHAASKNLVNSPNSSEFIVHLTSTKDTFVTVYMIPIVRTSVAKKESKDRLNTFAVQHGSTINMTLDKWDPAESYSVSMTRLDGRSLVASPLIISNGVLSINTNVESKGLYILCVKSQKFQSNTTIQIR